MAIALRVEYQEVQGKRAYFNLFWSDYADAVDL